MLFTYIFMSNLGNKKTVKILVIMAKKIKVGRVSIHEGMFFQVLENKEDFSLFFDDPSSILTMFNCLKRLGFTEISHWETQGDT